MTQLIPGPNNISISRSRCSLPTRTNGGIPDTEIETAPVRPVPAPPLPGQLLPDPEPRITAVPHIYKDKTDATELDVIIPAFNEATRLPSTLLQTIEFLAAQPWRSGVVIVDNGSADGTADTALRMVAEHGPVAIRVLGCARPGKGAAVRRGMLSSNARFVGFFDADLATPVETLAVALSHLRRGATAVIGSRHVPGAVFIRMQPLRRRMGGAAFRLATRTIIREIHDTQCGFKFFERHAVQRTLLQCRSTGFAFDVELLKRLRTDGGSIIEIPVLWADGCSSTLQPFRDGFAAFGDILSMRRYLR